MAIKLVVTREEVRERYTLQDMQDINDAIDSALKSAHLHFQGSLGTEWDEALGVTDVFYLNRELFPIFPNNLFRFRLKRAFVRANSVVVKYALRRRDLADASLTTTVDPTYYAVDYEKGVVMLDVDFAIDAISNPDSADLAEGNRFISITYNAGFDDEVVAVQGASDGTPATVTPATLTPPAWLKEAILVWVGGALAANSHGENPQAHQAKVLQMKNDAEDMIVTKKRETAFQFLPIY